MKRPTPIDTATPSPTDIPVMSPAAAQIVDDLNKAAAPPDPDAIPGGFRKGQRVRVTGPNPTLRLNETVTVRGQRLGYVCVEVDDTAGRVLHDCEGLAAPGHGWDVKASILSA